MDKMSQIMLAGCLMFTVALQGQPCPATSTSSKAFIEVDWAKCREAESVLMFASGNASLEGKYYRLTLSHPQTAAAFKDVPMLDGYEFTPYRSTTAPMMVTIENTCGIYQKFVAYPVLSIKVEAEPSNLHIPFEWGACEQASTNFQIPRVSTMNGLTFTFRFSAKTIMKDRVDFDKLVKDNSIRLSKGDCVDNIIKAQDISQIAPRFLKMLKENLSDEIKIEAIKYTVN